MAVEACRSRGSACLLLEIHATVVQYIHILLPHEDHIDSIRFYFQTDCAVAYEIISITTTRKCSRK